jgi:hypothetical protein
MRYCCKLIEWVLDSATGNGRLRTGSPRVLWTETSDPWLRSWVCVVVALWGSTWLWSSPLLACIVHGDKHNDPWRCHGTLLRHPSFEFIVFNLSFELIMFNLIFHALTVAPSSEPKGPCPRKLGKGPFWHWTGLPLWLLVPVLFNLTVKLFHHYIFIPSFTFWYLKYKQHIS